MIVGTDDRIFLRSSTDRYRPLEGWSPAVRPIPKGVRAEPTPFVARCSLSLLLDSRTFVTLVFINALPEFSSGRIFIGILEKEAVNEISEGPEGNSE